MEDRIERDIVNMARAIAEQDGVSVEAAALAIVAAALIQIAENVDGIG